MKYDPLRFTSITRRNSSGVSRVAGTAVAIPALLIRTSTPPSCSTRLGDDALAVLGIDDVGLHGDAAPPERLDLRLGLLEPLDPPRADRDVGARLGEPRRERDAEPRRRAGDDGHLAVEFEAVEDRHAAATQFRDFIMTGPRRACTPASAFHSP